MRPHRRQTAKVGEKMGNGPEALKLADWIQIAIALVALAAIGAAVWSAKTSKRAARALDAAERLDAAALSARWATQRRRRR